MEGFILPRYILDFISLFIVIFISNYGSVIGICFSQVLEEDCSEHPFSKLKIGQKVHARIVAQAEHSAKTGRNLKWELSIKPSLLKGRLYQNLSVCPFHICVMPFSLTITIYSW